MKKIFLFGILTRIFIIISFTFLTYAMIDTCFYSKFQLKDVILTIVAIIFTIICLLWIHTLGIIFDFKNNKLRLILGLLPNAKYERVLSNISNIDVAKNGSLGICFVVKYTNGEKEDFYFYDRYSFNGILSKRLNKKIQKINLNNRS